jgi:hypothetical protein
VRAVFVDITCLQLIFFVNIKAHTMLRLKEYLEKGSDASVSESKDIPKTCFAKM